MKYGKKQGDNGSRIILQVTRGTGIAQSVVASLLVTPSRLTMTSHEAVIPLEDQILIISLQCVPNIMQIKDQEPKKNTWTTSEIADQVQDYLNAIREEDEEDPI